MILVRPETKPDDIHGIAASVGVVTSRGGVTSHAAVVTRGMGIPCIVGCEGVQVNLEMGVFEAGGQTVEEGQTISIDGATGDVYLGVLETVEPGLESMSESNQLLAWADDVRRLGVMANADTPADAAQAVALGAGGIGLCRTEHMFLHPQRLPAVRQMLLNAVAARDWSQEDPETRGESPRQVDLFYSALDQVRQLQVDDFTDILRVMGSRPVIIRLLDAPLHEFLPPYEGMQHDLEMLRGAGASAEEIQDQRDLLRLADSLREENPMLGHRGCRLGLTFPDIYRMQVAAIITAGASLVKEGLPVNPEIMIPLTVDREEMTRLRRDLTAAAAEVQENLGVQVAYKFGTMIRNPQGSPHRRGDRPGVGFLQLRDQRPYPDDLRLQPGRRPGQIPAFVHRRGCTGRGPIFHPGCRRGGTAGEHGSCRRPENAARPGSRHLWRARRRPAQRSVLPPSGTGLR